MLVVTVTVEDHPLKPEEGGRSPGEVQPRRTFYRIGELVEEVFCERTLQCAFSLSIDLPRTSDTCNGISPGNNGNSPFLAFAEQRLVCGQAGNGLLTSRPSRISRRRDCCPC